MSKSKIDKKYIEPHINEKEKKEELDYSKIYGVAFEGIDHADYPDYCDAYPVEATYEYEPGKTRLLTDEELEEISEDSGFIYDKLMDFIF